MWSRNQATAQLLVDEVAANAVRHAHSPFTLTMTLDDGVLRCAVHDDDPHLPVPRQPAPGALDGRRLYLVAALADRWGVERHDGDGKTVWFELNHHPL